ncbi:MAG: hypothetical protein P1U56_07040 [Saprospiraceae bacterium]|nr:hypothetical protein [Saprospiraceae bacterium]
MILSNNRSLHEDIEIAKTLGYTEEFIFEDRKLIGKNISKAFEKSECKLVDYCLHEDEEQSILFLIESSNTKGCLSTTCEAYSDAKLIDFCMSMEKS